MAAPAFRTLDDIQRAGSSTSEEVARLIFGDTFLVGHLEDKRETFGPLPSVIAHHREWSVTPGLGSRETSESTADKLWSSYRLTIERLDGEWTRKELRKAKAGIFTANFKAFLEATSFLGVSTPRQFRSLGLSRRTCFYWVSKVKNGRPISDQYHIDFKLWLVWKCLELATKKIPDEDLVATWFQTPNGLLSKASRSPIDVLFNFDVRRRPRVLRILPDMPTPTQASL